MEKQMSALVAQLGSHLGSIGQHLGPLFDSCDRLIAEVEKVENPIRHAYKAAGSPYGHTDAEMWRWWAEREH